MEGIQSILNTQSEQIREMAFSRIGKSIQSQYQIFSKSRVRHCSVAPIYSSSISPQKRINTAIKHRRPNKKCGLSSSFASVDRSQKCNSISFIVLIFSQYFYREARKHQVQGSITQYFH